MPDIVYVFTNPSMPGLVKIGYTTKPDIQDRLKELYATNVPEPFECVMARQVKSGTGRDLEKALHTAFVTDRGTPAREFFTMDVERVVAILRIWPGKDATPPKDSAKTLPKTKKKPPLNFLKMGIPLGSTLVHRKTGDTAVVVGPKKVRFRGENVYLTAATRIILGYNTQPTPHWTYKDKTLLELHTETYGSPNTQRRTLSKT